MKLQRRQPKRGRVEIIPMIDTILILLIFYMSFSTFTAKERRMDTHVPYLVDRIPDAPPMEVLLHVRNQSEIVLEGVVYSPVGLRTALEPLGLVRNDVRVLIEAEPDTDYQAVINAMDACARARLRQLAFIPSAQQPDS